MKPGTERYLAQFAEVEGRLAGGPVAALRREALARFAELGFPTLKHEDWKYTNVAPIAEKAFAFGGAGPSAWRPGALSGTRLVFLEGRFAPELSHLGTLPRGVRVQSLRDALEAGIVPMDLLAGIATLDGEPFVALNTAFLDDGAFVHLSPGAVLKEPLHLLFATPRGGVVSHPRCLVVAETESQAVVVESHLGPEGAAYFANALTEISLAPGAAVEHIQIQRQAEGAFHVGRVQVRQERSSRFRSHAVSLGAGLARTDIATVFAGEGGECSLNGLYVASGHQHVDTHTSIDHLSPRCTSRESYKGVLGGHARGVFNGKVIVRPDAQKSDTVQTNKNLLLSEDAVVDTKPQLEIFADDVKATHGAAVGQLEEDAVFYLRSRGIPLAEARRLLTYAFASEIVERIEVLPVREAVAGWVSEKLGACADGEGSP
jgi:Fe-S cluster assembly protein SufD